MGIYLKKKLAHYKVPKYVCVVNSLPITVTGKPQKYKMREDFMSMAKTEEERQRFKIR